MTTERVDALHVVGAGCNDCRTKNGLAYITIDGIAFDAQKVAKSVLRDAAVAELIAAASQVAAELTRDPDEGSPLARLDAALARVGGAA